MPDDYNPIVLSGIVQRGGECITTKLTVGFQLHLLYLMHSGQPTSILIATGPHVMVNLSVGLPFVQAMGMILDMMDHVAELKTLDAPSFPIEYRRAMVHVRIVEESKIQVSTADYQPVVKLIEDLECHFAEAINPQPITTHASPKHISFVSCAINAIIAVHSDHRSGKHGLMDHDMAFYHNQHMGSGLDK